MTKQRKGKDSVEINELKKYKGRENNHERTIKKRNIGGGLGDKSHNLPLSQALFVLC